MKTLACDGCGKIAGDVRLRPGWCQLAYRNGSIEPKLLHFHSVPCMQEFLDEHFDADTARIVEESKVK